MSPRASAVEMTSFGKSRRGRRAVVLVLASALALAVSVVALAAPGDLDRTFSGDGKVRTNFTPAADGAGGVAIQTDGKIVAVGTAGSTSREGPNFALARYRADGTLDSSFGVDGKVTTRFRYQSWALDVAIQTDGKIVAVGQTDPKLALARYNPDGTLDTTFDGNGKATLAFPPLDHASAAGVAIQADGKIVVAGEAWCEETFLTCHEEESGDFAVARFEADGTLDASFSQDGWLTTDISGDDIGSAVTLQADGKIVVVGGVNNQSGLADFGLVRYNNDGTLDSTFGDGGRARTDFGGSGVDRADALAIQADGKLVAAGRAGGKFALVRYDSDGTPDAGFGRAGKVTTNLTSKLDFAYGVAIQATGKIVAAGRAGSRFGVARYTAGGLLDTTFGGDGKVMTDFTPQHDAAFDVALQATGKIVLAGNAGVFDDGRFALTRYRAG
jgi:uncharacterized delta-60 repeat protein